MQIKRYWLRGGIILAGLYLIALLLEIIFLNDCFGSFCVNDDWLLYLNPGVFFVALGSMGSEVVRWDLIIMAGSITALVMGVMFFGIGSVLGRIYGKIIGE